MLPNYWPAFAQFVANPSQHFDGAEPSGKSRVRGARQFRWGTGLAVSSNAEEFRRRADECYRLSVQVQNPEHKALALYLAAAWVELAQQVERREVAGDRTIDCDPADPQPKDQIE
jgi:hypothetical protein